MIALLVFGIAVPGIGLGLLFGNGAECVLGLLALGMALVGLVWRDTAAYVNKTGRPR